MQSDSQKSESFERTAVLLFSEDQSFYQPIKAVLDKLDIETDRVVTVPDVLGHFEKTPYPLLLLDADGSFDEASDLIATIRKSFPDCVVLVAATEPTVDLLVSLSRIGTYEFLRKPVDIESLSNTIRFVCQKSLITETKVEVLDRLKSSTALLDHRQVELYQHAFRINDELKNLNQALKRHVSQLTILYQMGRDISENENWSDALDRFLMALVNYMNAEGAAVLLFSDNEGHLAPRSSYQVDENLLKSSCSKILEKWSQHPRGSEIHSFEGYEDHAFDTCLERTKRWKITLIPLKHRNRSLGFLLLEKTYSTHKSFKLDYYFLNTIQTFFAEEVANASYISELRQLSRFNEKVLDNINSGVITTGIKGTVRFFNKRARALCPQLGQSEPIHFNDMFRSASYGENFFEKIICSQKDSHVLEVECPRGKEAVFTVRLSTSKMYDDNLNGNVIVAIFEDLTEQKRMEAEIRKHDRLRVLGQLSACVAHEIRNPLTGIATSVEVLGNKLGEDNDKVKYILAVLDEINRLDGIIRDLLNFARPVKPRLSPCSLPDIAGRVINLLSDQARNKGIKLIFKSKLKEKTCFADADQITQVFLNIVLNAIQACEKGDRIEMVLSDDVEKGLGDLLFARVDVVDSGTGVPESIRDNIFEPFVTTKTKGSGLGLAISQQIIEEHGGRISCDFKPGETTFSVLLPPAPRETAVGKPRT